MAAARDISARLRENGLEGYSNQLAGVMRSLEKIRDQSFLVELRVKPAPSDSNSNGVEQFNFVEYDEAMKASLQVNPESSLEALPNSP